jgi:hypothetical protein
VPGRRGARWRGHRQELRGCPERERPGASAAGALDARRPRLILKPRRPRAPLTSLVGTNTVSFSWGLLNVLTRPSVVDTCLMREKLGWPRAAVKLGYDAGAARALPAGAARRGGGVERGRRAGQEEGAARGAANWRRGGAARRELLVRARVLGSCAPGRAGAVHGSSASISLVLRPSHPGTALRGGRWCPRERQAGPGGVETAAQRARGLYNDDSERSPMRQAATRQATNAARILIRRWWRATTGASVANVKVELESC